MNYQPEKLLYFAYGSNLHIRWLNNRVVSAVPVARVVLKNRKLQFNKRSNSDNSAKCNIIKTGEITDMVHGVIYEFDANEKNILDKAEDGYQGKIITIGRFAEVLLYEAASENIDDVLLPYTWYKDIIITGACMHCFPDKYIEYIKSFPAISDPDPNREKMNRAIVWPDCQAS